MSGLLVKAFFTLVCLILVSVVYMGSETVAGIIDDAQLETNKVVVSSLPEQFQYLQNTNYKYKGGSVLGESTDALTNAYAKSLPVLYYHGVSENQNIEDVKWDVFRDQMHILKENGYSTITMSQAQDFLINGSSLPEKSFLLHFDDGRKDSFYPVDPILAELDFNAVMFVITSTISHPGNYHLGLEELRKMVESGRWELESHGHLGHSSAKINSSGGLGHWYSNLLWLEDEGRLETIEEYKRRVTKDLRESKEYLRILFDHDVKYFAIPFGDYGQNRTNLANSNEILSEILANEFIFSFYQPWDENLDLNYVDNERNFVRRVGVESNWSAEDLLSELQKISDKNVDFMDNFSIDTGWKSTWGDSQFTQQGFKIFATDDTTGSSSLLKGTYLWDNFQIDITALNDIDTESFSILAKMQDNGDYLECQFSEFGAAYREKVNGKLVTIKKWEIDFKNFLANEQKYSLMARGNEISCLFNSNLLGSQDASKNFNEHGLIGVSNWSKRPGLAETTLRELRSKSLGDE